MAIDDDLVLVTGASGFIAIHVVKQLLEEGYRVRGSVRSLKNETKIAPLRRLVESNPKYRLDLVEADLLQDECWFVAVKDCTYVIHVASPFPLNIPDNESEVLEPAVNGTLRVLRACVGPESMVKRVVLTSSFQALYDHTTPTNQIINENNWANPKFQYPYPKSKTLAEKAAWDFVNERKRNNEPCFELAVINPSCVMGPLIHDSYFTATEMVKRLLEKKIPVLADVSYPTCDVRDVALAHVRAMKIPEAANNRHLICSTDHSQSIKDYADILAKEFAPKGYTFPTRHVPNFLIRTFGLVDKSTAIAAQFLGKNYTFDNSRMRQVLKIETPRPVESSVIDMAYSLLEKGMISTI